MLASVVLVLLLAFVLFEPRQLTVLVARSAYWICAAMLGYLLIALWRVLRGVDLPVVLRTHAWGLLLVLACSTVMHVQEPHRFKVLNDEYALAGTARSMHMTRDADVPSRAHFINGRLTILEKFVDKRRQFYPFLVSLAHDVTGYRPSNAFVVNAVLGVLFLGLVYGWGVVLGGPRHGMLAVLLISTLPLLAQVTASGAVDLLNITLLVALLPALRYYDMHAGTRGLDIAVALVVMAATTRYEAILYLGPLGLVVLCKWWRERRVSLTWASALSPLLLTATVLTDRAWPPNEEYFKNASGGSIFGLEHLPNNLQVMVYYLFSPPTGAMNNSLLLSFAGGLALVALLVLLAARLRDFGQWPLPVRLFAPMLLVMLATTMLIQVYFWGQLSDPVAARFALPLMLGMTISVPALIACQWGGVRLHWAVPTVVGAWFVFFSIPQMGRHEMSDDIVSSKEGEWFTDWAERNAGPRALIVSNSSISAIIHGHPAVMHEKLRSEEGLRKLLTTMRLGVYDEVYVLDRRTYNTQSGQFDSEGKHAAPPGLVLEKVEEIWFRPMIGSFISRVVGVRRPDGTVETFERLPRPSFESEDAFLRWYVRNLP